MLKFCRSGIRDLVTLLTWIRDLVLVSKMVKFGSGIRDNHPVSATLILQCHFPIGVFFFKWKLSLISNCSSLKTTFYHLLRKNVALSCKQYRTFQRNYKDGDVVNVFKVLLIFVDKYRIVCTGDTCTG
jgi:hypothetical protein